MRRDARDAEKRRRSDVSWTPEGDRKPAEEGNMRERPISTVNAIFPFVPGKAARAAPPDGGHGCRPDGPGAVFIRARRRLKSTAVTSPLTFMSAAAARASEARTRQGKMGAN